MIIQGTPDILNAPTSPTGLNGVRGKRGLRGLNASPLEISLLYESVLGREPDAAGMAYYVAQGDKLSYAALQAQLADSVEGRTSADALAAQAEAATRYAQLQAIAVAAPAILAAQTAIANAKEVAQSGGTAAQLEQAAQVVTATVNAAQLAVDNSVQTQITAGLLTSQEQAAYVQNKVEGEVWQAALEQNLFQEVADLQNAAAYATEVNTANQAAIDAQNKAAADEAERQRLATLTVQQRNVELAYDQLVRQAYKALGRETIGTRVDQIDQEGYDYWIGRLRGGMTQADFVSAFVAQAKANIEAKKAAAALAAKNAAATGQDATTAANAILDSQDATKPGAYAGLVGTSPVSAAGTGGIGALLPVALAVGAYFLLGQ
jgi:hypothetical protein